MAERLVMVFGAFDVVHPGHVHFLSRAKRLGKKLLVVVTRDSAYRKEKKHAPCMNERERLAVVAALKSVDAAVLGDKGAPSIIQKKNPAIIAVGYDQDPDHPYLIEQLKKMKQHPRVVVLTPHKGGRLHSSKLKRSWNENH